MKGIHGMTGEDEVDEAPEPGIETLGGSRGPYQLLPPLTPQELTQLEDSIRLRGVEDPISVDEEGQTLDGHHRRAIADRLGVAYETRVIPGLSEDEKRLYAIRRNTERRQLTKAQRALVGLRAEPAFRAVARARQGAQTDLSPNLAKSRHVWTAEEAARLVGLTVSSYRRYRALIVEARRRHGAAWVEAQIERGAWDIGELDALHREELARQRTRAQQREAAREAAEQQRRAEEQQRREEERLAHWQTGGEHRWARPAAQPAADQEFWECAACGAYSSPVSATCTHCGLERGRTASAGLSPHGQGLSVADDLARPVTPSPARAAP